MEIAHSSASKGHIDIDCYGQHVCSGRCEVLGKSLNKRPDSSEVAHLFNNVQWNIDQEWRINCQEIFSNGSLILAYNMYISARDVSLIFTDRNIKYTELTDGFLWLRGSVYCVERTE